MSVTGDEYKNRTNPRLCLPLQKQHQVPLRMLALLHRTKKLLGRQAAETGRQMRGPLAILRGGGRGTCLHEADQTHRRPVNSNSQPPLAEGRAQAQINSVYVGRGAVGEASVYLQGVEGEGVREGSEEVLRQPGLQGEVPVGYNLTYLINKYTFIMKYNPQDNVKAQYRNTRSKFYTKPQKSFEGDDNKPETATQGTGGQWKEKGNEYFKAKNYDKAIECYSKAIEINSGESQYYSNRSKCYQKQGNFTLALKDAEVACQLDEANVKAHYTCGCILGELGKFDDSKLSKAENRLKKALRLCTTSATQEYSQDISIKIFRLKKLIWLKEVQRQQNSLKAEAELIRKCYDKYGISKDQYEMINSSLSSRLQKLKQPREIPDHLICKITLEMMEDPVVSEAGFTYERKALQEHYKMKGAIEPIARKECKGYIIPNHALKIAIQQFLNDHPWGFQFRENEDYRAINMV